MKTNTKLDLGFYLIPILLFFNLFLRWDLSYSASPDTYDYIDLAENFPIIKDSLFPIFYPICLKIINFITCDYFISYKVWCVVSLVFSLSFVKIKDFYWREIWVMFTFMSFLKIAPWGWSELIMIPLILLTFYCNYQFLNDRISTKKFIFSSSSLLLFSVLTKYSSLFFIGGFLVFSAILFLIKDKKAKAYMLTFFISLLGSGVYLLVNYFLTGSAMGQRIPPDKMNIVLSFSQILFNLNPLFNERQNFYLGFSFGWGVAYLFGVLFLILFSWIIFNGLKRNIKFENSMKITFGGVRY